MIKENSNLNYRKKLKDKLMPIEDINNGKTIIAEAKSLGKTKKEEEKDFQNFLFHQEITDNSWQ